MKTTGFLLSFATALALRAVPTLAQIPAELPGRWETRSIGFTYTADTPDSVRNRLNDPNIAELNRALASREAHLVVAFQPDGSYVFTISLPYQSSSTETGTYTVQAGRLQANSTDFPDGSSFHDQEIRQLTRRTLLLAFPVGAAMPGVEEEIEYRRVR